MLQSEVQRFLAFCTIIKEAKTGGDIQQIPLPEFTGVETASAEERGNPEGFPKLEKLLDQSLEVVDSYDMESGDLDEELRNALEIERQLILHRVSVIVGAGCKFTKFVRVVGVSITNKTHEWIIYHIKQVNDEIYRIVNDIKRSITAGMAIAKEKRFMNNDITNVSKPLIFPEEIVNLRHSCRSHDVADYLPIPREDYAEQVHNTAFVSSCRGTQEHL